MSDSLQRVDFQLKISRWHTCCFLLGEDRVSAKPPETCVATQQQLTSGETKMRVTRTLQNAVLASLCAFSALPVQAATTVIDFNSLATATDNPTVVVPSPYIEDGFKLTTSSGSPSTGYAGGTIYALTPNHGQWMGSPAVYSGVISTYGSTFVLERADGGVFDLLSMDVGLLNNYPHFDVYGYYPQGGYTHQYTLLAYNYTTLQTLTFGDDFKGVNKLVFSSVYAQVDNINLSVAATVPEPETWAMLLAGLGLVGFVARRRSSVY